MKTVQQIITDFGLKRSGRSWRGGCPVCGYGGTLSVRDGGGGKALIWCAACPDREALIRIVGGGTYGALPPVRRQQAKPSSAENRRRAIALWAESRPISGTPAEAYLVRRGLAFLAASDALRYHPALSHPDERGRYPAMVAIVCDVDGQPCGIHRTYLRHDGMKAGLTPGKATLGPIWGGAIRLFVLQPGARIVIGEGIETAAAAGRLMGLTAWSGINAKNLGKGVMLPPMARSVVIAADPDDPGDEAAWDAYRRWRLEGREVRVTVPEGDQDFADLLLAREAGDGR